MTLSIFGKVGAGFLQGIVPSAKHDIRQPPKPEETGFGTIGSGEEDVGVEEEPVHKRRLLGGAVGNGVGIEAEAFDFAACAAVVGNACGSGKKEFGFALRGVFFDGNDDGGAKKDAILASFGGHKGAFVEAEALAELCRDDDGASFADFSRFHDWFRSIILHARLSDIQANVDIA